MSFVFGFLLVISTTFSSASELQVNIVQDAKPIIRIEPKYPIRAAKVGQEAWVQLSYIVEPDGSVSFPVIEDSSGGRSFERAAMKAIKKWKFSPALENGKPIQQCHNRIHLWFSMTDEAGNIFGPRAKFIRDYKEIDALIEQGKVQLAQQKMRKIQERPTWNLYEITNLALLQSQLYQLLNQPIEQYASLVRLYGSGEQYLSESNYLYALQELFILDIKNNRLGHALKVYDKIKQKDTQGDVVTYYLPYVAQAKKLLVSEQPIVTQAHIGDRGYWHTNLSRFSFTMFNDNSTIDKLDIRCKNKRLTDKFIEGKTWNLPQSWGQCSVFVYGEQNSKFDFVELATTKSTDSSQPDHHHSGNGD